MPRKLPVRLHLKNGGYYYVFRNKWDFLSRDYPEALRLYADKIAPKKPGGIPDVIDRALAKKKIADNTRKAYTICAKKLKIAFAEFNPSDLRPVHFYQWLDAKKITDNMAQTYRSVMIAAMALAVREGLCDTNVMKEVQNWKGRTRDRYLTDAEYLAVRDSAKPTLKAIITISLQTGQRISDVLKIRYPDLGDDGIYIDQKKGQGKNKLCIAWTPDLREAVAVAKATHTSVKGMTLFSGRKGKPIPYSTVRDWWLLACAKSGVENGRMHDILAKTGTDARKQGLDSKALLGHKSDASHERYQRDKDIPIVQPLPMVKP